MQIETSARLLHPINEAVYLMAISRSVLYQLMDAGEIEYVKIGSRRLIPHESLERFAARLRGVGG